MNEFLRRILFLPSQSSSMARDIDWLHYSVILTTMLGAAAITLVGGLFVLRYRRGRVSGEGRPFGAYVTVPLWAEAIVITFLFGLFITWWAVGARQFVRLRVPPEGAMTVYVTGKQWMWKFATPDGQSAISQLTVPVGRPVKLVLTSRDVIHSFYVPDFRIKMDAVPGRYTTQWFTAVRPGRYPVFCTEYCGAGHSIMRGEIVALEPDDYERWRRGQVAVPAEPIPRPVENPPEAALPNEASDLAQRGLRVAAEKGCLRCHTTDGSPHIGPTWAGVYGSEVPLAAGGTVRADEAYLTESMMDPLAKVHRGFPPVMPSYQGQLPPAEAAALVELIRSLRDVPAAGPRRPDFLLAPGQSPPPAIAQPPGTPAEPPLSPASEPQQVQP